MHTTTSVRWLMDRQMMDSANGGTTNEISLDSKIPQTSASNSDLDGFWLHDGALDLGACHQLAQDICARRGLGAVASFSGIVRADDGVSGLSFDIYEPILREWFLGWCARADGCTLVFAHSIGDVLVGQSSYFAAVLSRHRALALGLIEEFVEDFKRSAPIWKYDLIATKRRYAHDRSTKLPGVGYL